MHFTSIYKYKGLIFDLDGTLVNSMPYHIKAWLQVASEHGFTAHAEDIERLSGSASRDIAKFYQDKGCPIHDIESFVQRKISIYKSFIPNLQVFTHVYSILKEAKNRGVKIAVGTGSRTENATIVLKQTGIFNFIDSLVTADDVKAHKPNPDTFLKCAQNIQLKPHECLVFEDGQLGIISALRGGFDCIEVKEDKEINYFEVLK